MTRQRRRDESGASAVEFAFVLIPLTLLLFVIIDFGFIFGQDLAIGNSSREAARYGAVQGNSCTAIISKAKDASLPLVTLTDSNVTVKRGPDLATADAGVCTDPTKEPCKDSAPEDNLYVVIDYSADVMLPVIPGVNSIDVSTQGVFRCEFL